MKKIICLLIIAFILIPFVLYSENHYCVQISAYPAKQINNIWEDKNLSSFLSKRNDCILEPRKKGAYYGICCGDFKSYIDAKYEELHIKSHFPNAFARRYYLKHSQKIINTKKTNYKPISTSPPTAPKIAKKIIKPEEAPSSVEIIRKPAPIHFQNKQKEEIVKQRKQPPFHITKPFQQMPKNKNTNYKKFSAAPTSKHGKTSDSHKIDKNKIQNNTPTSVNRIIQGNLNNFDKTIVKNIINNTSNSEYEIFSLKRYFNLLEKSDIDFKSSQFDSKLYQVNALIESDKYNPNIYFSAGSTLRKTYNVGSATSYANLDALAALYFDWHIYDAQKKYYTEERKIIFERLSRLNLLNSKDKLFLNGTLIYLNLWYLQKIVDRYSSLLKQQEKLLDIARVKSARGESNTIYETIDTQNDYYNLELAVSDIREMFLQQEYLFRQSIDLNSPKTIYLYDPIYKPIKSPVLEIQKEAIANNKELAKLQEEYKLSKSDLALAAAEKGWNFDFFSYAGYGYSKEIEGSKITGKGIEWQIGIRAAYPLYSKNDINLKVRQKKLQVKKAALRVASKIKTLALTINKLYNSYEKLQYKSDIYNMQNKILKKRLDISYARFIKGEGSYKQYSDTLKIYTDSLRAKFLNESFLHSTVMQLYILTGKNLY
jgi:outer membrane protein TolC